MRLNPAKCTFGVPDGKFLDFMLTSQGDKCWDVIEMRSPSSLKEVQRLATRIASLQRFLPKLVDKSAPFLKILKNPKDFRWTDECEKAFQQLKSFLASPSILTRPTSGKELYLYLSVSQLAISSLIVQEEGKQQWPGITGCRSHKSSDREVGHGISHGGSTTSTVLSKPLSSHPV